MKAFKHIFEPEPGRPMLRGHSSRTLDDEGDLVTLRTPADQDRLTMFVQTYCLWLFVVSSVRRMFLVKVSPRLSGGDDI